MGPLSGGVRKIFRINIFGYIGGVPELVQGGSLKNYCDSRMGSNPISTTKSPLGAMVARRIVAPLVTCSIQVEEKVYGP